MQKNNSVYD